MFYTKKGKKSKKKKKKKVEGRRKNSVCLVNMSKSEEKKLL